MFTPFADFLEPTLWALRNLTGASRVVSGMNIAHDSETPDWPHDPHLDRDPSLAALEEAWRLGDTAEHDAL